MSFLPINRKEMEERGWQQPDFVLVTGDAYVDHHSFGTAIISRLLERYGYKVAILPQPDYKTAEDLRVFGKPRLGFLIKSGVVDSMVNNYSVFRHKRKVDEYAPGGKAGSGSHRLRESGKRGLSRCADHHRRAGGKPAQIGTL